MILKEKTDLFVGAVVLKFLDRFKHEELQGVLAKRPLPDDPELNALTRFAYRVVSAPENRPVLNMILLRNCWLTYLFSSSRRWERITSGTLPVMFIDAKGGEEYWAKISDLRPSHLFVKSIKEKMKL
ncbi:hypothetical protein KGO95_01860 [Patescibacteria group bacterium]|nr:hypothetical protein [Patescibacteria group bacterium]